MGLFRAIWELFKFNKELKRSIAEAKEEDERYLTMTTEEVAALSDEDLLEAAIIRTENAVQTFDEWEDGVNALNDSQKLFYALNWLEMEVNNGGLCQFFVNSSRMVAPWVSEYMGVIGATDHKKLYDDFVSKNNIDLNELSFFDIEEVDEFAEKAEAYPFEEYDDAFYDMAPIETYLKPFVREHVQDF